VGKQTTVDIKSKLHKLPVAWEDFEAQIQYFLTSIDGEGSSGPLAKNGVPKRLDKK
jgi:hypothetical protein